MRLQVISFNRKYRKNFAKYVHTFLACTLQCGQYNFFYFFWVIHLYTVKLCCVEVIGINDLTSKQLSFRVIGCKLSQYMLQMGPICILELSEDTICLCKTKQSLTVFQIQREDKHMVISLFSSLWTFTHSFKLTSLQQFFCQ